MPASPVAGAGKCPQAEDKKKAGALPAFLMRAKIVNCALSTVWQALGTNHKDNSQSVMGLIS
jgi:hypothetical protein